MDESWAWCHEALLNLKPPSPLCPDKIIKMVNAIQSRLLVLLPFVDWNQIFLKKPPYKSFLSGNNFLKDLVFTEPIKDLTLKSQMTLNCRLWCLVDYCEAFSVSILWPERVGGWVGVKINKNIWERGKQNVVKVNWLFLCTCAIKMYKEANYKLHHYGAS